MKTVVIFGGSGFIGRNIIRRLSKKGYRIIVPFQKTTKAAELRLYGDVGQVIPLKFGNLNEDIIKNVIDDAEIVINLKTIWQEKKAYSYKNNIFEFNINLIDLINYSNKNKGFVFFSGIGVKKNSPSTRIQYISKVEDYMLRNLSKGFIIKPSIVIGERNQFLEKLLPIFKTSIFIPVFGKGETKLQPVFVDDVARAVEKIIAKNLSGNNIYELVGSEIFTYRSFYQYIADCLGLRRKLVPISFKLAEIITSFLEKINLNILTKEQLILFKEDNIFSGEYKGFKDLDIYPQDIRKIIKKIVF